MEYYMVVQVLDSQGDHYGDDGGSNQSNGFEGSQDRDDDDHDEANFAGVLVQDEILSFDEEAIIS